MINVYIWPVIDATRLMIFDTWYMIQDLWYLRYMIYDIWSMVYDTRTTSTPLTQPNKQKVISHWEHFLLVSNDWNSGKNGGYHEITDSVLHCYSLQSLILGSLCLGTQPLLKGMLPNNPWAILELPRRRRRKEWGAWLVNKGILRCLPRWKANPVQENNPILRCIKR